MAWLKNRAAARALKRLPERLVADYAGVGAWLEGLGDPLEAGAVEAAKMAFVRHWFEARGGWMPDDEQLACVAEVCRDVQVVARAGSGKTSTVVGRACFLVEHCGVRPSEMLILAFNRRAVADLKTRLERLLSPPLPHVMTFHGLAHRLVKPEEELLYDDAVGEVTRQSRVVRYLIEAYLEHETYGEAARRLMLAHFGEPAWESDGEGRGRARKALDWERVLKGQWELGQWEVDRFSAVMRGFVARCRKRRLTHAAVKDLVRAHRPASDAESLFLSLAEPFYGDYLSWLGGNRGEDFDGLVERACGVVESGRTCFRSTAGPGDLRALRHVFIDEFQDFSELFWRMVTSLRGVAPAMRLFCVGDDWQAINGFAGSDLRFFEGFGAYLGAARRLGVRGNYRSGRRVVEVSNRLMVRRGDGEPGVARRDVEGGAYEVDLSVFPATPVEFERFRGDLLKAACVRLSAWGLQMGLEVALLCRTNRVPAFGVGGSGLIEDWLDTVRWHLPEDLRGQVSAATVHQFKGLECGMVVLVDVFDGRYPLIHPDWVFGRLHGDSERAIEEEERRLLYVGMTRAAEVLVVITDSTRQSLFLDEMKRQGSPFSRVDWGDVPMSVRDGQGLFVRVESAGGGSSPTWRIREALKAGGFRFRPGGRAFWEKAYALEGFDLERVKAEPWAVAACGVQVSVLDDVGDVRECFIVEEGSWRLAS